MLKTVNVYFRMESRVVSSTINFMLCLVGTSRATGDTLDDMTVVRENYCATFHKQGILDNAHSVWHQTFVVSLEESALPKSDLYCGNKPSSPPNDTLTLQHVCPTIQSYIKHQVLRRTSTRCLDI